MTREILLKRGKNADFGSTTLKAGEPAFITDTGKLYVGDGTNKVLINPDGYNHPTGDGNSHVPATGTSNDGKYLKAGSTANSAAWADIDADVRATTLTGLSPSTSSIAATDSILTALGKAQGQLGEKAPTSHAINDTTYGVATASNYGHVKVTAGNGLSVSSGTLSMAVGTTSAAGAVKVTSGNGLSISSGTISMSAASTSAAGAVKLNTSTSSTSTTEAATASAVKAAYDLATTAKDTIDNLTVIDGGTF